MDRAAGVLRRCALLFACASTLMWAGAIRAQAPCEQCWTDKCPDLKGILPKCKVAKPKVESTPKVDDKKKEPPPCADGKERNVDTAGHCCWPAQAWNGSKCVGVPSSCPSTHVLDIRNEACALPECAEGQERALDGVHCCWPGQAWSSVQTACVGQPQCATDWRLENGACISPAELKRREEEAAAAAERARVEEEARKRRAAEEEAARLERERQQQEAIERAAAEARARAEAERLAREAEAARRAEEQRRQEAYRAAKASAQTQRNLAVLVGGAGALVAGVGGVAALGGLVTNAEIASGKLADGDAIQETADRGQFLNTLSWSTLIGGGIGVIGAFVWHTLAADPAPPT